MKKLFFISVAFLFLIGMSCKKKPAINNYIVETETSEALSNKDIDSTINLNGETVYIINNGGKTVFKHDHTWENQTPGVYDGYTHMTYAFTLSLATSQTSFTLIDNQIKEAIGCYYHFSSPGAPKWELITNGKITGTKINSTTWYIVMHFEFPNTTVDLAKNFTIK